MTKTDQRRRLEQLAQEINETISNSWLFPERGKVQGFLGTAPIMVVGERPSTGKFEDSSAVLLYDLLEMHGAANAHLTDVIKSRGKVGESYPEDMAPHRHVFEQEIEIIRPRLVVAFGQKVYDLLQFFLAGSGIKITKVWHYAYTRRGADKVAGFKQQMQKVFEP
jgi:uracil-DNA glycosylase